MMDSDARRSIAPVTATGISSVGFPISNHTLDVFRDRTFRVYA